MPDQTGLAHPPAEVRVEARLSAADRAALDRHVQTVLDYQAKSVEAAVALAAISDGQLYVEAGTFPEFAQRTFGIGRRRAYQLARAGRVYAELRDAGADPLPVSEAQLRPLAGLDDGEDRRGVWGRALRERGGDPQRVTMADVELAAAAPTGTGGLPGDLALAAVERAAAATPTAPPADDLHAKHRDLLGTLRPEDQAEVWGRAARRGAGSAAYDDEGRLSSVDERAVRAAVRELAAEVTAPADDGGGRTADGPGSPAAFAVLLERHLLRSTAHDSPAGGEEVGGSVLVPYDGAEGAVAALVEALDRDGGVPDGTPPLVRRDVLGRRAMARCRLEPDIAAWTWPALTPGPRRTATAWFPDADAPAPCYVPARLTQPERTRPTGLDLRLPTARTVLLAPDVDLLRGDVPDDVVRTVLDRAAVAEGRLVFLAATNRPDRVPAFEWPGNVLPALRVEGDDPDAVVGALDAFERAGAPGALVLDDAERPLEDRLVARLGALAAVVLRGPRTGRGLYDQALRLRGEGVALVAGSEVKWRPWDPLLMTEADVPTAGRSSAEAAAVTADLPRPSAA